MSRSEVLTAQTGPTRDPTSPGWPRFFWLVFNRSSIAMTLLDDGRVTVAVNQAMCDYVRRPRDEMIDRKVDVDISPPTQRRFQAAWESLIQVGDGLVNVEVVRSDGVVLHSEFAARTATIDGRRLVLGVLLAGAPISFSVAEVTAELSPREREVVHLLTLGLTSPEIAERLSISVGTVRTHVRNAMAKTGTRTRAHLVAVALADHHTYGAED
jgi:DNA-binding CsgD family transcriptional regulator